MKVPLEAVLMVNANFDTVSNSAAIVAASEPMVKVVAAAFSFATEAPPVTVHFLNL